MLGHLVLTAAMIGQTSTEVPATGPVLSEWAKEAQARALAEFRAREHTIPARLAAYYQLENERLGDRIHTVGVATNRNWSLTAGTSTYNDDEPSDGFSSVPPARPSNASGRPRTPSLDELRRENFLLKGRLRDGRWLYREAHRDYRAEYPVRMLRATQGRR